MVKEDTIRAIRRVERIFGKASFMVETTELLQWLEIRRGKENTPESPAAINNPLECLNSYHDMRPAGVDASEWDAVSEILAMRVRDQRITRSELAAFLVHKQKELQEVEAEIPRIQQLVQKWVVAPDAPATPDYETQRKAITEKKAQIPVLEGRKRLLQALIDQAEKMLSRGSGHE